MGMASPRATLAHVQALFQWLDGIDLRHHDRQPRTKY